MFLFLDRDTRDGASFVRRVDEKMTPEGCENAGPVYVVPSVQIHCWVGKEEKKRGKREIFGDLL
jgi:hypothetical protein